MKRYLPLLIIALALTGCGHKEGHRGFTDEAKDPTALGYDPQAMQIEEAQGSSGMTADGSHFITGVALRGSQHSITLHVLDSDEEMQFSYPTLPIDKIAIWQAGDTVTVYFKDARGGNDVTRVIKGGPIR